MYGIEQFTGGVSPSRRELSMVPLLLFVSTLMAAGDGDLDPQIVKVVAASEHTRKRIAKESVQWTMELSKDGKPIIEVVVQQAPDALLFELKPVVGIHAELMASVLCRGNTWFFNDGQTKIKYRPFEAPLPVPNGVQFIQASMMRLLDQESIHSFPGLRVQSVDGDRMTLRIPVDPVEAQNLRGTLQKITEFQETLKQTNKEVPAESKFTGESIEDLLKNGHKMVVDQLTGQILETGLPQQRFHYSQLDWLGNATPVKLREPKGKWIDRTSPISRNDLKDVIQITHNRIWQPSQPSGDTDLMLVNVRTREIRRVPFQYSSATAGAFSLDRSKIYVTGLDLNSASIAPFTIDLKSGECQRLGDDALGVGNWLGPVLSASGDKLAISQLLSSEGFKSQIHVVNLADGKSTAVGQPMDAAMLNWHPDGRSLIFRLREPGPSDRDTRTVCRMTMDGTVTKLIAGDFPELLSTEKRILFQDMTDQDRWKTCDLEGRDPRLFGDGFQGFGFPSASRDGRLIMLKFKQGTSPTPHLIDVKTMKAVPLDLGPGLWATPKWR